MSRFDDDNPFDPAPRKKPASHEIGQPLDTLSVDELEERIALLREEIARLEAAKTAKEASKHAAASFFKS
ncbi:DUF1192 domain-containing protein [Methylovirgula sp. 4M-Z18]|uniref:DUF1192 domain-containing protein n=1 Tax=Methylovirgula sp. 4M-Z18 TaxID=2293567 RepID=UPI000E2EC827|nr:DUF1192 domain-containing protein [Methylovirgula sp. 4M-Z18]RFB81358.1 DUF1192 domain-containing protein [Methylovirgula sp. 4M-Z18]